MAKKILCVIRVSTLRQQTESQHNDMLSFLNGRYSDDEIEWLEVAGASARKANAKYIEMLDSIKNTILQKRTIKACAFWHLNRLGRIESYINLMKEWFIKNKIQVYVKTPTLTLLKDDGSVDAGANISWSVFASLVAYDTEEMIEKMARGKTENKSKGMFVGGRLKFGFTLNSDKFVVPDETIIPTIQLILNEYSSGQYSIVKLLQELKSRGISVTEHNIASVISDELYKSFVSDEVWQKCRKIREINKTYSKESVNHSLVKGIVKCAHCGGVVISSDTDKYACYQYKFKYRTLTPCSEGFSIKKDVIDTILWDIAIVLYQNSLLKQKQENIEQYQNSIIIIDQKINECIRNLNDVNNKIERAAEAYTLGGFSKEKYVQIVSIIKADANSKEIELKALRKQRKDISLTIEALKTPDIKGQITAMLSSEVIVNYNEKKRIIDKFISTATIGKAVFNGKNVIEIIVTDVFDQIHTFYYFKYAQKGTMTDKIIEKKQYTGEIIPYLKGNEGYINRAQAIIQSLKEIITK